MFTIEIRTLFCRQGDPPFLNCQVLREMFTEELLLTWITVKPWSRRIDSISFAFWTASGLIRAKVRSTNIPCFETSVIELWSLLNVSSKPLCRCWFARSFSPSKLCLELNSISCEVNPLSITDYHCQSKTLLLIEILFVLHSSAHALPWRDLSDGAVFSIGRCPVSLAPHWSIWH